MPCRVCACQVDSEAKMPEDYYVILGVDRSAGEEEIKRAYRKMALKYHPDRNNGDKDAETRFKEAAEAYEVLRDPEKRQLYDHYGRAGLRGQATRGFSSFQDIFEAFGDIFGGGSIFDDFFAGGGRGAGPRRGASLRCDIEIDLEEVVEGGEKAIEVARREICPACKGTGAKPGTKPKACPYCHGRGEVQQSQGFFTIRQVCPNCRGAGQVIESPCAKCQATGRVTQHGKITVRIPPGLDDGTRMRVAGQGEPGDNGAPRGDLYCDIHIKPHPFFERHGDDILCELPVTFTQAALGATLEVPGLSSKAEVKVPRGTQGGDMIVLGRKGLPDLHGHVRGNQLVRVVVEVPKKLTPEQEELLRKLAETEDAHVSEERKSFFDKLKEYFG